MIPSNLVACADCGSLYDREIHTCPNCNSGHRLVVIEDTLVLLDKLSYWERMINDPEYQGDYKLVEWDGDVKGPDGGLRREVMVIDRENNIELHIRAKIDKNGIWKIEHYEFAKKLDSSKDYGVPVGKKM